MAAGVARTIATSRPDWNRVGTVGMSVVAAVAERTRAGGDAGVGVDIAATTAAVAVEAEENKGGGGNDSRWHCSTAVTALTGWQR